MNGMNALTKENPRELPLLFCNMRTKEEDDSLQPRRRLSPEPNPANLDTLISDCQSQNSETYISVVYKPLSLIYFRAA